MSISRCMLSIRLAHFKCSKVYTRFMTNLLASHTLNEWFSILTFVKADAPASVNVDLCKDFHSLSCGPACSSQNKAQFYSCHVITHVEIADQSCMSLLLSDQLHTRQGQQSMLVVKVLWGSLNLCSLITLL